jgi:hypothetical protein
LQTEAFDRAGNLGREPRTARHRFVGELATLLRESQTQPALLRLADLDDRPGEAGFRVCQGLSPAGP